MPDNVQIYGNKMDSECVSYNTQHEAGLQVNEYLLIDERIQNPVKYEFRELHKVQLFS